ncbi:MAG: hypothetical protein Q9M36_00360 [Sulfurovum sp.]|nr:hypothetical protein [Sulfurovum sp.]
MLDNNDDLMIKCPKYAEVFTYTIAVEKQKGVVLIDCPYCNLKHKINFGEGSKVEVYRAK